ncbi:CDP-alcohol phosphatidyltransferase family protein [Prosthecobacter sp.]|uniref:CDP-alcohol phosphatidyltransferase family protein n=1 Tax=Prosthecobacter sp. TaxID=1965333 RepID=UPI0025CD20E9|nr:CDP-alcohol phosphatidyltransferase family protein [Prosthecobacter sp.]
MRLTGVPAVLASLLMNGDSAARRPLKSRTTAWAGYFTRVMLRMGLKPNTVSLLGILCAAVGGGAMLLTTRSEHAWLFWLIAAAGVQLRLFCNMMDGLLAVEGGLRSPTGDLYNEIPDRIDDALILVPLGYAGGTPWTIALGWAAMGGAVLTAYVRALGASLTGKHDFCGPMAKPHRMFIVTLGCLGMAMTGWTPLLVWTIAILNAGIVITVWRRTRHLASVLHQKQS